jgi:hypothetical protein
MEKATASTSSATIVEGKEKTKERTKNAVSGRISTRTQLKKDKKRSRNSGFCYRIGKAMAVPVY